MKRVFMVLVAVVLLVFSVVATAIADPCGTGQLPCVGPTGTTDGK